MRTRSPSSLFFLLLLLIATAGAQQESTSFLDRLFVNPYDGLGDAISREVLLSLDDQGTLLPSFRPSFGAPRNFSLDGCETRSLYKRDHDGDERPPDNTTITRCRVIYPSEMNDMCEPFYSHLYGLYGHDSPVKAPISFVLQPGQTVKGVRENATWDTEGIKVFNNGCRHALNRLLCVGAYIPCYFFSLSFFNPLANATVTVNNTIPVPRLPCNDVCQDAREQCKEEFEEKGIELPDCNQTTITSFGPIPVFPEKGVYLPLGIPGQNTTFVPCFRAGKDPVEQFPFSCPEPMVYMERKNPNCQFPCPAPIYEPWQYDFDSIMKLIFKPISMICCILVVINFVADPNKRNTWPGRIVINIATAFFMQCGSAIFVDDEDEFCRNYATPMNSSDIHCSGYYFFGLWGGVSAAMWWATMAVNASVCLIPWKFPVWLQRSLFVFIWTVTAVLAVLPVAFGKLSGASGVVCNVDKWWGIAVVWVPILTSFSIVLLAFFPTMYHIVKVKMQSKGSSGNVGEGKLSKMMRRWSDVVSMSFFMLYLDFSQGWAITAKFTGDALADRIGQGYVAWITCSIGFGVNCRSHAKRMPFWLFHFATFLPFCSGIVLFLCFCCNRSTFAFWSGVVKNRSVASILGGTWAADSNSGKSKSKSKSGGASSKDSDSGRQKV